MKSRVVGAKRGQLALHAAERRDDVEAAAIALRAEDEAAAVGRPGGLRILGGRPRHLHGIAAADRLDPDVRVAVSVGGVGEKSPVRRQCGVGLEPRTEGQARERTLDRSARSIGHFS